MLEKIPSALVANGFLLLFLGLVAVLALSGAARNGGRAVLRLLVHPLLLIAVIALVYDGTRMLAGEPGLVTTSVAEHWAHLAPASFEGAKAAVSRRISPVVWDPFFMSALRLPAWLFFGLLALAASYAGRRQHQINVFAN